MSHGGGENEGVYEKPVKRKSTGKSDEFALGVAKIAVAQICESAGYQTFQLSALETLSDVAVRYMRSVAMSAHSYANLAGRSQGSVFDVIQGLEEHGSSQGYSGASNFDHCLGMSGTVREIVQYVTDAEDIPFAYSIPRFPVVRGRKPVPTLLGIGEEPPEEHIPAWLPTFPDPQTLNQSNMKTEGSAGMARTERLRPTNQPSIDSSLLTLRPQLFCNGFNQQQLHTSVDSGKGIEMAQSNPFLAPPLRFGEKEVSHVDPPVELANEVGRETVEQSCVKAQHELALETFSPPPSAMQIMLPDYDEGKKKGLSHQRPSVHFKVGVGKKPVVKSFEIRPRNKGVDNNGPWFTMDDETDDKKRRAEKVMQQSMENPGELAQL